MSVVLGEKPSLPWSFRAFNTLGSGLSRFGLARINLDPDHLIAQAKARTGLSDFGPDPRWREGLDVLVDAFEREAGFTWLGRYSIRQWLERTLDQRLGVVDAHQHHPEISAVPVKKPIFILGFHRTGTTVLHSLFGLAPGLRAPRMWELMRPSPPPDPATEREDPRVAISTAEMRRYLAAVPDILSMHPLDPLGPDECIHLMALSFRHRMPDAQGHCPSFMRWVRQEDMAGAYAFHRAALQVLSWRYPPRRWVLKAPTHLFHLDALLREYPDAVIVQTHRHPADVAASCCSLFETTSRLYRPDRDPLALGRSWVETWEQVMPAALAVRDQAEAAGVRFLDLHFRDLRQDPEAQTLALLEALGEPVPDEARSQMRAWLAANRRERHGDHRPSLARYGLNRGELSERFSGYIERFGL